MGARQSKRSVDITTSPKKGVEPTSDGSILGEGEGKLEKIPEVDTKITTNGSLHTEQIEFADKDESGSKDEEAVEATESKISTLAQHVEQTKICPETTDIIKEKDSVASPETEKTTAPSCEDAIQTNEGQSMTVEAPPEKIMDDVTTPDNKKSKEKKKKKWSIRSISFSKKDKSKPRKEAVGAVETDQTMENGDDIKTENGEDAAATPPVAAIAENIREIDTEPLPVKEGDISNPEATANACDAPKTENIANETTDNMETIKSSVVVNGDSKVICEKYTESVSASTKSSSVVVESTEVLEKAKTVGKQTEITVIEIKPMSPEDVMKQLEQQGGEVINTSKTEEKLVSTKSCVKETVSTVITNGETSSVKTAEEINTVTTTNSESSTNVNKEVRSDSPPPPPLPTSNPPSPVTMFAETTKADHELMQMTTNDLTLDANAIIDFDGGESMTSLPTPPPTPVQANPPTISNNCTDTTGIDYSNSMKNHSRQETLNALSPETATSNLRNSRTDDDTNNVANNGDVYTDDISLTESLPEPPSLLLSETETETVSTANNNIVELISSSICINGNDTDKERDLILPIKASSILMNGKNSEEYEDELINSKNEHTLYDNGHDTNGDITKMLPEVTAPKELVTKQIPVDILDKSFKSDISNDIDTMNQVSPTSTVAISED